MITHQIPNLRVFLSNCRSLKYRLEYTFIKERNIGIAIIRAWCDEDSYFPEVRGIWKKEKEVGTLKTPTNYCLLV